MKELEATPEGLTSAEAKEREMKFGKNELEEKHVNPILRFLSFLWNPLSCTMEIAAILSGILGDWVDLGLIIGKSVSPSSLPSSRLLFSIFSSYTRHRE
jgi:H+-transporting ATPase